MNNIKYMADWLNVAALVLMGEGERGSLDALHECASGWMVSPQENAAMRNMLCAIEESLDN